MTYVGYASGRILRATTGSSLLRACFSTKESVAQAMGLGAERLAQ
jgi:hypothetical protein